MGVGGGASRGRTGWAMRGDRRPGGGWRSQSHGECHLTKSPRVAPGLAALKADMSAVSMGALRAARASSPLSPSPVTTAIAHYAESAAH